MDIQKVASTGTAVAVLGGGSLMGGNYALDQATGGPEKRIKAKQAVVHTLTGKYQRRNFKWQNSTLRTLTNLMVS